MRILLYRGTSLLSRLIKWRTWSDYSHSALELSEGEIVDAWKGGVRVISDPRDGHDPQTGIEAYRVRGFTDDQAAAARAYALAQVGSRYDYRGVLRFLSRRDPPRADNKWFCSELVFAAFRSAGVHLLARVEPHRVSPGDLARSPLLIQEEL